MNFVGGNLLRMNILNIVLGNKYKHIASFPFYFVQRNEGLFSDFATHRQWLPGL